jgi:GNAT superfamily N-acetyltransferase
MGLSFQVEQLDGVFAEIQPLLARHWEELAVDQAEVALDPNWQRYRELDAAGALSVVTARADGRLVGYSCMILSPGLHYRSTFEARMDVVWLAPELRGQHGGARLLAKVERELARRGVRRVYLGSKLHKDIGRLFEARGYVAIETWFSKLLDPTGAPGRNECSGVLPPRGGC